MLFVLLITILPRHYTVNTRYNRGKTVRGLVHRNIYNILDNLCRNLNVQLGHNTVYVIETDSVGMKRKLETLIGALIRCNNKFRLTNVY